MCEMSSLKYVIKKSLQQEDEINVDGIMQTEKNKPAVQECTYPSTPSRNSVSKYDNASPEKDIAEGRTVEMFLHKKVKYPWMLVENTKLESREVRSMLGSEQTHGIRVYLASGATLKWV
jgi:hypothetical protein